MSELQDRMRNFLCDKLFEWAFGDDEADMNEALLQASDGYESKIMPRCCTITPFLTLAPS